MNAVFAFGLVDNPWVVVIILLVTALSSWLSKRRQAKETLADKPPMPSGKPPAPGAKPREFDLEEAMRRLLGEDAFPKPQPTPPPIPRPPPAPEWEEEGPPVPPRRPLPAPLPPRVPVLVARPAPVPVAVTRAASLPVVELGDEAEEGAHSVSLAALEHPAASYGQMPRPRQRQWPARPWRDPRNARQAFVASLVFGPPKGFEP